MIWSPRPSAPSLLRTARENSWPLAAPSHLARRLPTSSSLPKRLLSNRPGPALRYVHTTRPLTPAASDAAARRVATGRCGRCATPLYAPRAISRGGVCAADQPPKAKDTLHKPNFRAHSDTEARTRRATPPPASARPTLLQPADSGRCARRGCRAVALRATCPQHRPDGVGKNSRAPRNRQQTP